MTSVLPRFEIEFPQRQDKDVPQDVEVCDVTYDGRTQRIRFHDYTDIYEIPGLYEYLFHDELECVSPRVVCDLLAQEIGTELRVLDVGAGNGLVGEELRRIGADPLVAVDILPAAAAAAERDRPEVYDEYLVADLTAPDAPEKLAPYKFNCMVTVAALGFGDMPPAAFRTAYDAVEDGGLVALTINEDFLGDGGFSDLVRDGMESGALEVLRKERYQHRLSVTGEPIYYVALVMRKRRDI